MFFIQQLLLLSSFAVASPNKTSETPINIRVNPVGVLIGMYQTNVDIGINEQITVGPQAAYMQASIAGTSIQMTSIGVRGNYFLNGVFNNGIYAGPAISMNRVTSSYSGVSVEANAIALQGMAGYGWFYDNFNIMLGAGFAHVMMSGEVAEETSTYSAAGFGLELSVGWKL